MIVESDYQWYKSHHICPRCRVNTASSGRVYCESCLSKSRPKDRLRKAEMRKSENWPTEEYKATKKKSYDKLVKHRKEMNVCVRCGNLKQDNSKQYCNECLVKFREYNKKCYQNRKAKKNEH